VAAEATAQHHAAELGRNAQRIVEDVWVRVLAVDQHGDFGVELRLLAPTEI
jgi:hypothetical protein